MAIRAFKATFLVAIDEDEAVDNEDRDQEQGPVTVEELKQYLNDALCVDWDNETNGNPCGVTSMEVGIENLIELDTNEVKALYDRN